MHHGEDTKEEGRSGEDSEESREERRGEEEERLSGGARAPKDGTTGHEEDGTTKTHVEEGRRADDVMSEVALEDISLEENKDTTSKVLTMPE